MKITIAALLFVCATAGCTGALDGNDGGSRPVDAPACSCHIEGGVLMMTLGCLCEAGYCEPSAPPCSGPQGAAPRTSYPACGLTTVTQQTIGGPNAWVYDWAGKLVGKEMSGDSSWFVCPSDPNIKATHVRAGRFPEPTCAGTPCACADGVTTCDVPDAGASCGCSLQSVPYPQLAMSWDCFCDKFSCGAQLISSQPGCEARQRTDYPECGLTWVKAVGAFGFGDWVFDSSGQLVGETAVSDTSPYVCSSDPGLRANSVRSGRYPESSCRAVECEQCYAGPFPCPAADGGARD